ncbi:unnamed protein product [Dibothriocephalus latus]|uniref:TGS domain-containing protein n=1 Tax=Dibothriocephalus latus TaxID=60516 RepID=A0A3P6TE43_DIBLA|nr:unnamed protein product [Dibothriocephalus latus]
MRIQLSSSWAGGHNLIDVTRLANAAALKDYPSYVLKQSKKWSELKNEEMRSSTTPNVQRIDVAFTGFPKSDAVLSMAKGVSTPYDCAKHLSQLLRDRSVLALVNGMPYDMHRPLTCECELDFIHFKDIHHDPTPANLAFWRSSQVLLAAALVSSFRKEYELSVLDFPQTSLESGSFVVDVRLKAPPSAPQIADWKPAPQDLRAISERAQRIANASLPFEVVETSASQTATILEDPQRMQVLAAEATAEAASKSFSLYRLGDYVQVYPGPPLIASSGLIGRFSLTSMKCLGRLSPAFCGPAENENQMVYRAQGIGMPTAFLTHFTTFDILMRRARETNPEAPATPIYLASS